MRRLRGEGGAVAGWEALPFGFLVLIVGSLVIANAWGVVDAKAVSAAAAREGARAFVESPDGASASAAAAQAATAAVAAQGRDPDIVTVSVEGSFARCAQIAVTVEVPVDDIPLPWVGGLGPGLSARSTHAEVVDPLRSGVPGEAYCVQG